MSQLTEIVELEDKSALSSLLSQPSVFIDVDRSGSISADEIYGFLDNLSGILDASKKKDLWLRFNHEIRNKGKEMKPRVQSKKNADRFKLSDIPQKFEVLLTDGEG